MGDHSFLTRVVERSADDRKPPASRFGFPSVVRGLRRLSPQGLGVAAECRLCLTKRTNSSTFRSEVKEGKAAGLRFRECSGRSCLEG